jgi:hypothetical protein
MDTAPPAVVEGKEAGAGGEGGEEGMEEGGAKDEVAEEGVEGEMDPEEKRRAERLRKARMLRGHFALTATQVSATPTKEEGR